MRVVVAVSEDETVRTTKEEESGDMRKSNRYRSCLCELGPQGTSTSDDFLIHLSISPKRFCGSKYFSPAKEPIPCWVMQ